MASFGESSSEPCWETFQPTSPVLDCGGESGTLRAPCSGWLLLSAVLARGLAATGRTGPSCKTLGSTVRGGPLEAWVSPRLPPPVPAARSGSTPDSLPLCLPTTSVTGVCFGEGDSWARTERFREFSSFGAASEKDRGRDRDVASCSNADLDSNPDSGPRLNPASGIRSSPSPCSTPSTFCFGGL